MLAHVVLVGDPSQVGEQAVADFNDDDDGETVEQIAKEGWKSAFVHADVSEEENVRELVAKTVEAFNNAGVEAGARLHETSAADWNRTVGST